MAGPCCVVIAPLSGERLVDELVGRVSSAREGDAFWVTDSSLLGGKYRGDARPFVFRVTPFPVDQRQVSIIQGAFGFVPGIEVELGAMCNDAVDWMILELLAIWLSEQLHGVVNLCHAPSWRGLHAPAVTLVDEEGDEFTVVSPAALRELVLANRTTVIK